MMLPDNPGRASAVRVEAVCHHVQTPELSGPDSGSRRGNVQDTGALQWRPVDSSLADVLVRRLRLRCCVVSLSGCGESAVRRPEVGGPFKPDHRTQMTFPSGTVAPPAKLPTKNALIPSVLNSPSPITRRSPSRPPGRAVPREPVRRREPRQIRHRTQDRVVGRVRPHRAPRSMFSDASWASSSRRAASSHTPAR